MANVRLLRQLAQRYDDRVAKINREYQDDRGIYEKAVEGYNADLAAVKAGTQYLMKQGDTGQYAMFGGTDKQGNIAYQGSAAKLYDTPLDNSTAGATTNMSGENPVTEVFGETHWVRNPDGTATLYTPGDLGGGNYGYTPDRTVKLFPEGTPSAPTIGDPGRLGLTEKEKGLLNNPTYGPSEMNIASARGVAAQSSLAGDQPTTPTSAFANPEDPNNLKEKGVLARVLGGQL